MKSVGFIGFGNMGEAFGAGLRKANPDLKLAIMEPRKEAAEAAKEKYNVTLFTEYKDFFEFSDIIVLAIKPQDLETFFSQVKEYSKDKKIISIAAGKKISFFQEGLGTKQVVRYMPNLAAKQGKSVVGYCYPPEIDATFKAEAVEIAEAAGFPLELPEKLMPAITGVSGSGIAYVFSFIHGLAMGGVQAGIPYPKALDAALETVEGAVSALKSSGENPIAMVSKVTSPGGTTIAGIKALEDKAFTATVMDAVKAACDRAIELEN